MSKFYQSISVSSCNSFLMIKCILNIATFIAFLLKGNKSHGFGPMHL